MTDSRLPPLRRPDLEGAGASLWDSIATSRGQELVGEDGALRGPFNAWVHAPTLGNRLLALGTVLRFESSIERRLLELAIITVGAHWKAEFEWWAHSRMAREAGLSPEVIEAVRGGTSPPFSDDSERIVHAVAGELVRTGSVSDATYGQAEAVLGPAGLVELVSLCGYYTLVCFTLNAFTVPLPPGEEPAWPR
ncbi:MAG TPA: carboxymuconolactone decarboxylase family protein [Acidimicrobiales bacterium]|nr:carboxymuconolactone decarboxylase family protein [Acidimicrobiales bacterium]